MSEVILLSLISAHHADWPILPLVRGRIDRLERVSAAQEAKQQNQTIELLESAVLFWDIQRDCGRFGKVVPPWVGAGALSLT